MANKALICELENKWLLIQLGPSFHNLNIHKNVITSSIVFFSNVSCLYNLTLKGQGIQLVI